MYFFCHSETITVISIFHKASNAGALGKTTTTTTKCRVVGQKSRCSSVQCDGELRLMLLLITARKTWSHRRQEVSLIYSHGGAEWWWVATAITLHQRNLKVLLSNHEWNATITSSGQKPSAAIRSSQLLADHQHKRCYSAQVRTMN